MGVLHGRLRMVSAAVVGLALLIGGAIVAVTGYTGGAGPAEAVRQYYRALAAGDAPKALAWGTVPSGPHTLLTSAVLKQQLAAAPIRDVSSVSTTRTGSTARVKVKYTLGFPAVALGVTDTVAVVERHGDWRLARAAVVTQLVLPAAGQRAEVNGGTVPTGLVPVFPGAAPITFDTPYLDLDPAQSTISFATESEIDVGVEVSAAGRRAARAAVTAALTRCVTSAPAVTCPVPSGRFVPGSLHGTISSANYTVTLDESAAAGVIDVTAQVPFRGSYRRLGFTNRARAGTGSATIDVHALAYAAAPLSVHWGEAT
jgi:hypothetical protein